MDWVKNKSLRTIRADWKGNPREGGRFGYTDKPFQPSWTSMLRWMLRPNPQRREKQADDWRPPRRDESRQLQQRGRDFVCWLGHAAFLLEIAGHRLLIDPVLSHLPFLRRKVDLPFELEALGPVDYILLSHDHRDHCDQATLQALARHTRPKKVLTSLGMRQVIASWLPRLEIEEAAWYQVFRTPADLEVIYLPARHWCRRGLFDFNRVLWGSFLVRSQDRCIYFGADSGYAPHFAEIGHYFPGIQLALLGIGAYKPAFMMEEIHTSPKEAFRAYQDLAAARLLPMHYGTYDLSDEPISEPYRHIQRIFEQAGREKDLLLPAVGAVVWLDELSQPPKL